VYAGKSEEALCVAKQMLLQQLNAASVDSFDNRATFVILLIEIYKEALVKMR